MQSQVLSRECMHGKYLTEYSSTTLVNTGDHKGWGLLRILEVLHTGTWIVSGVCKILERIHRGFVGAVTVCWIFGGCIG